MDNLFQNNSGEKSEHPPRAMLMLLVDGELAAKDATQLEAHLEACWACRAKTKKIQEAIADIIEFDEQVLTPRIIPPQGWRNFDRQLSQLAEVSGKQSLSSRLFSTLNRFLPSSHLVLVPRPLLRPMVRIVATVLITVLVIALVIRLKPEPTVSASELLGNAIASQARQIKAVNQAVVHQKLQVRRKAQSSATEEVNWEIWNDIANVRVRQFLANGNQSIPVVPAALSQKGQQSEGTGRDTINELARVLELNHMDPQRPLSAASYQSWHNTLHNQQDQVTKTKLADGNEVLTLRTVATSAVNVDQIAEASFVVRAKDWQPTELHLTVVADDGNRTYELTQTIAEVVTLAQVNPAIFAEQPIVSLASATSPKEIVKSQPAPSIAVTPSAPSAALATNDLEVEVLQLLHNAGADLGEQVSASIGADGLLRVTGIVDTAERKVAIVRALQPVADHPAVRIEIQTVAEALAKQKRGSSPTVREGASSAAQQDVDINREAIAAAPELRRYLQSDEQVRQFAVRIVNQSNSAMRHVYAMKRLIDQFSPAELGVLTPEAKNKWLALIRTHAKAYQSEASSIRNQLQPIFPNAGTAGVSPARSVEITNDDELIRAVNRLFDLASSSDSAIRAGFTMSSSAGTTPAIGSAQFWQSMKSAEGLAGTIGSAQ